MPIGLRIRLLGHFRADDDGELLSGLDAPRLQALVAYLALHRDAPVPRHRIAFLFWPDSSEAQAQTNLRQLLHRLRKALPRGDEVLRVDRRTVRWDPAGRVAIDVVQLEEAWSGAQRAAAAGEITGAVTAAERAARLYGGDLLPSCYDDWIEPERERLRRLTVAGLSRLIGWLEDRGEWRSALGHAQRLLELDPLQEQVHRTVIRLHALAGDPAMAERAYRRCRETLSRELGIEPSEETEALLGRVRSGRLRREGAGGHAGQVAPPTVPLIGRQGEWERVEAAWRRATAGRPGVALVTGEAGIGKTRLADALVERIVQEGGTAARARCWAAEGLLPFAPVAQWLGSRPFETAIAELPPVWLLELGRVLPHVTPAHAAAELTSGGPADRLRLFEALARTVTSPSGPLLLMLDDLQWCDRDTLEWLHYLLRYRDDAPLLLLATLRSGEPAADARLRSWLLQVRRMDSFDEIELGPLDATDSAALAAAVAGRAFERMEADALFAETEGHPLFLVEMVRSRHARGGAPTDGEATEGADTDVSPAGRLPARVRAVIRARLELLSPDARELVSLLATIGRDFTFDVVRRAGSAEADRIAGALDELARRHLIREQGAGAYDFSHDKLREVAYAELSGARRTVLHEQVARALESAHEGSPERIAGEVARHLDRAGRHDEAIPWYRRAADRALELYANREAVEHLDRALALLRELPDTDDRAAREIDLQTALGVPLVLLDHYAGERVWKAYSRAKELCERLGRPVGAPVLRALSLLSLTQSRLPEVVRLADALMAAAAREGDPMMRVEAHYVTGVAAYWEGRLADADGHLRRALELYQPDRARAHLQLFTQDPATVCGVRLALAEWHLGRGDEARRRCLATIEEAEALEHPFTLGYARAFGSWVLIECGDLASARGVVAALRREGGEAGLRVWWAMGGIAEGYLLAEAGNPDGGLERIAEAAGVYRAAGNDLGFPYHQGLLARVHRLAGRNEDALAAVDEGLAMAKRTGQRFWDAELHRLRGEVLRDLDAPVDRAVAEHRRALRIAREQGALGLVRRAERALAVFA